MKEFTLTRLEILDLSKLKAFADNKLTQKHLICHL